MTDQTSVAISLKRIADYLASTDTTAWAYDPASRTVYDTATDDAVCILSDLGSVDEMHKRGTLIAMAPKLASALDMMTRALSSEPRP